MYGTGWIAPNTGAQWQQPQQYPNQAPPAPPGYQPQQPPPQSYPANYGQNQGYFGQNQGYNQGYPGPQEYGLQQPPNAYAREGVYSPPAGPPPGNYK
ncbi:hypothetical protein EYZ11_000995 [Aspergillus tanneri]|nr:hypothetical protein EYZ11_000995 [Aspergillus tanneri]